MCVTNSAYSAVAVGELAICNIIGAANNHCIYVVSLVHQLASSVLSYPVKKQSSACESMIFDTYFDSEHFPIIS